MSVSAWTYLFVGLSFSLYLGIAWRSRVRDTRGFFVAGRGVPAMANGMATAADYHNIVMTFEFLSRREVMPGRINLTESILEETKRHGMTLI